jgi:excisionase family DNA binding protein
MDAVTYTIDQVCELTGVSRRTVRYYVQEGLLSPPVGRGRGGNYLESHVKRLREIKSLQEKGWTLSSIERYLKTACFPATIETDSEKVLPIPETREQLSSQEVVDRDYTESSSAAAMGFCRTVRATFNVAPGVDITVDREVEDSMARKIQEIVRIATTILSGKE